MPMTRRETLALAAGALAATTPHAFAGSEPTTIEAVLFDAFPVLDPRPIYDGLDTIAPGQGKALGELWRSRQFEYAWLRVAAGEYEDFWKITRDGLVYAAEVLKIDLTPREAETVMNRYLTLKAWPDAKGALAALREQGLRLALLSNFTPRMLQAALRSAGLGGRFAHALSTDAVRTFKPDPRAYRMAIEVLKTPRERILFVPSAGWDAAGAKWFGYETFWVNRFDTPPEALGVKADGVGRNLDDVVAYVRAHPRRPQATP